MQYFVYIMASDAFSLYVGVTRDLHRRVYEHRHPTGEDAFTTRHGISRLVYFEFTSDIRAAIAREKQIKGWRRSRKVALIEQSNPKWDDLAHAWFVDCEDSAPSLRSG